MRLKKDSEWKEGITKYGCNDSIISTKSMYFYLVIAQMFIEKSLEMLINTCKEFLCLYFFRFSGSNMLCFYNNFF